MKKSLLALLVLGCTSVQAASFDITSREYKVLLDPTKFTYGNELADIEEISQVAADAISTTIIREVTGVAALEKERSVTYWDVPEECTLRNMDYSFRERSDVEGRNVTLKVRKADRYISGFEDLSTNEADFESKFEDDLLLNNNSTFLIKASNSTKINGYTKNINKIDDIYDNFPGFEEAYAEIIDSELELVPVGGVSYYERRYEGQVIDLGQFDADLEYTLWYLNDFPAADESPVVVEVSFVYEDPNAEYTQKVVQRAAESIFAVAGLEDWVSLDAKTKTDIVYEGFCTN